MANKWVILLGSCLMFVLLSPFRLKSMEEDEQGNKFKSTNEFLKNKHLENKIKRLLLDFLSDDSFSPNMNKAYEAVREFPANALIEDVPLLECLMKVAKRYENKVSTSHLILSGFFSHYTKLFMYIGLLSYLDTKKDSSKVEIPSFFWYWLVLPLWFHVYFWLFSPFVDKMAGSEKRHTRFDLDTLRYMINDVAKRLQADDVSKETRRKIKNLCKQTPIPAALVDLCADFQNGKWVGGKAAPREEKPD